MLNLSNQQIDESLLTHYPLKTLQALPHPAQGRRVRRWLVSFFIGSILFMFLPWQQTITGEGTVSALSPKDRPQTIQNVIGGRIERWKVQEGQFVRTGDTLLVISDVKDEYFDPNLPQRLNEQLTAKQGSQQATDAKIAALDAQLSALQATLQLKLAAARNKLQQTQFKVISDSTDLIAQRRNYQIAQDRVARYEQGYKAGLFSLTDLESRRLTLQSDYAKTVAQENKLQASRQDRQNARIELDAIRADVLEKQAKAQSDRASAVSYRTEADGEVSKLRNKISSVSVRRGLYVVRAPQDGYIVRSLKTGLGETIKEGESIATLQPASPRVGIELYVRAMDVPLIQPGRHVRLQFDGWPAVQFSGWPAVAVGTFGGEVSVIDAFASPNGMYRMLVKPRAEPGDQPWPKQLRVGSGVYGWVMLDDVPIWYEIWRQLNGFPPSLKEEPTDNAKKAQ